MKKVIILLLLFCFLLIGGYLIISIVFPNTDRDIIKYEGRIYSNITELDWFDEEEKNSYQKGKRIGEIKTLSKSSLLLWDFSATKLPKGTVLYDTVGKKEGIKPMMILTKNEKGEFLYYRWLPDE